jgi:hypothetical protein
MSTSISFDHTATVHFERYILVLEPENDGRSLRTIPVLIEQSWSEHFKAVMTKRDQHFRALEAGLQAAIDDAEALLEIVSIQARPALIERIRKWKDALEGKA